MAGIQRQKVPGPPLHLVVGARAYLDEAEVIVMLVKNVDELLVEFTGSRKQRWTSAVHLRSYKNAASERQIKPVAESDEAQEAKALAWTQALQRIERSTAPKDTMLETARELGVSLKTVRRHLAVYRDNPTPAAQLPGLPGPQLGSTRLGRTQESLIANAIKTVYALPERPTIQHVHAQVSQLCAAAGVRAPSYKAIRARLKRDVDMSIRLKRLGTHRAESDYKPGPTGIRPEHPLDIVQIDHAWVDVVVVHPENRKPIGRPWITVAIDVNSRCILGYYLGFEMPNQTHVGLCLDHACNPKGEWLKALGSAAPYPMFGVMRAIHWDNGKTFQAKGVRIQCERNGIEVNSRPVRKPRFGAYIERYIGTLMRALHLLPGTTFSNTKERGDYKSENNATMTLRELELWIVEEIAKYHNSEHRGLNGATPAYVWQEYWKDGAGNVRLPPMVGDPRDFYIGFLPSVERLVQTDGVSVSGVRYWDPALTPLIRSGAPQRFHFDQRDLSKVYLADQLGYIDIPIIDRSIGAFSAYELKQAKRELREKAHVSGSKDAVFEAMTRQREIEKEAASKSKAARRSQSKRAGAGIAPPAITSVEVDYSAAPPTSHFDWDY